MSQTSSGGTGQWIVRSRCKLQVRDHRTGQALRKLSLAEVRAECSGDWTGEAKGPSTVTFITLHQGACAG